MEQKTGLPEDLFKLFEHLNKPSVVSPPTICEYYTSGPIHLVRGPASMKMDIIFKGSGIFSKLRDAVSLASPEVAISGAFYDILSTSPKLLGEIVKDGSIFERGDRGNYANIMYMNSGEYQFNISPIIPLSNVKWGLGGLIPIIINSTLYSGDSWFMQHDRITGRCIIGHNKSNNMLLILAQDHNNPRYNLTEFQNFYKFFGCENVVGLDGSTSAMLWYKGGWILQNTAIKNNRNPSAVGFRL